MYFHKVDEPEQEKCDSASVKVDEQASERMPTCNSEHEGGRGVGVLAVETREGRAINKLNVYIYIYVSRSIHICTY